MSCILPDVFALNDIGQDDIFIATTCDELGVVFADVKGVDIVVMDVFVVFYHDVFGRVVETDAAVFGAGHAVLAVFVEFYGVDRAGVDFLEGFEGGGKAVL